MLPAYAGLLGSMGLAVFLHTTYLLPLTAAALLLAVGALGFRARRRRGYGPCVVGLLAAALVVVGKFVVEVAPMTYGGMGLLIAASVWNAWPIRAPSKALVQLGIKEEGLSEWKVPAVCGRGACHG